MASRIPATRIVYDTNEPVSVTSGVPFFIGISSHKGDDGDSAGGHRLDPEAHHIGAHHGGQRDAQRVGHHQAGVAGGVAEVVDGGGGGDELHAPLGQVSQHQDDQLGILEQGLEHLGDGDLVLIGSLGVFRVLDLLITFGHLEVRIVTEHHDPAQHEGRGGPLILLAHDAAQHGGEGQAGVGPHQAADVVPGRAGGGQGGLVLGGLAHDGDQRGVGHIADVPDHVGDDGGDDDDDRRQPFILADADELEGEDEGHDPGRQDQPGAIAAPLLGLGAVQYAAVDPAQAGVDDAEYRVDDAGHGGREVGEVRQECHEVEGLDVAHQHEAGVADAEEVPKRRAEALLLSLVLTHGVIPPHRCR